MKDQDTQDPLAPVHAYGTHSEKDRSTELNFLSLYRVYSHTLDREERRALWLVEVERRSYDEVAEIMGCAWVDVKQAVFHGRLKLYWGMGRTLEELEAQPVH